MVKARYAGNESYLNLLKLAYKNLWKHLGELIFTFRNDVCMMGLNPNVSLARAGAVAQYVSGIVIFCGGQSHQNPAHKDCLYYSPVSDAWHQFTTMKKVCILMNLYI